MARGSAQTSADSCFGMRAGKAQHCLQTACRSRLPAQERHRCRLCPLARSPAPPCPSRRTYTSPTSSEAVGMLVASFSLKISGSASGHAAIRPCCKHTSVSAGNWHSLRNSLKICEARLSQACGQRSPSNAQSLCHSYAFLTLSWPGRDCSQPWRTGNR